MHTLKKEKRKAGQPMAERLPEIGVAAVRRAVMDYLREFLNSKYLRTAENAQLLTDLKKHGAKICLVCMTAKPVSEFTAKVAACANCRKPSR